VGKVSLRTFLRSNFEYKSLVSQQGRGEQVTRLLRLARLPHWVWVVEAHVRADREAGRPCVAAECVFDSTSSDRSARMDAMSLPGITVTFPPDEGSQGIASGTTFNWRSHRDYAGADNGA
jgi:hypothetical protein